MERRHTFQKSDVVLDGHGTRLRHQFVSTRFSDQNGGARSILFDLLPQSIDVRFEGVRSDTRIIAPNLLQQSFTRDRSLARAIEVPQDRGLLLRQPDLVSFWIEQDLRARPKRVRPNVEDGVLTCFVLPQLRTHAREQDGKTKRLWQG